MVRWDCRGDTRRRLSLRVISKLAWGTGAARAAETLMALTTGTRLGPYEILSSIGAGGMGEVYKARDTRLDRTVAIKVLPTHVASHPDLRQRFEREARAVAALNHPHICTLHGR